MDKYPIWQKELRDAQGRREARKMASLAEAHRELLGHLLYSRAQTNRILKLLTGTILTHTGASESHSLDHGGYSFLSSFVELDEMFTPTDFVLTVYPDEYAMEDYAEFDWSARKASVTISTYLPPAMARSDSWLEKLRVDLADVLDNAEKLREEAKEWYAGRTCEDRI